MFESDLFKEAVIGAYRAKKNHGELDARLIRASPAKVRDLCLIRLARDLSQDDQRVFKDFFDPFNKYHDLEKAVKTVELEKLRPLQNFVLEYTSVRNDDIVKLLAVLIDFQPRPYEVWKRQRRLEQSTAETASDDKAAGNTLLQEAVESTLEKDVEDASPEIDAATGLDDTNRAEEGNPSSVPSLEDTPTTDVPPTTPLPPPQQADSLRHTPTRKKRIALYALIGLLFVTAAVVGRGIFPPKSCMYWADYQFVAAGCDMRKDGTALVARDDYKIRHFKKIMHPDTLDIHHVNQVWYSKINNDVEFFSAPGFHPIHKERALKAATALILEKYAGENAPK